MRVTVVMNPSAGGGDHDGERILSALARRGDDLREVSSKHLGRALDDPGDLVVAVGGDGTVAKVAREVGGAAPIHIVPAGTSNNIARSLGIGRRELDLDVVRRDWQATWVDAIEVDDIVAIESAGCGAIAHLIRRESDPERKGPRSEKRSLSNHLDDFPLFDYRIEADGETLTGEAFLIEVMVMPQIGPRVVLARDADPCDGLLDLVVAREEHRAAMQRYLKSGRRPPELPVVRGASFTVACHAPWHVDDELVRRCERTMTIRPRAWQVMLRASPVPRLARAVRLLRR